MKKILYSLSFAFSALFVNAQTVSDTVSTGATYSNQIWYSLGNDNQGSAAKNNWDLAFDAGAQGSTILINSVTGTTLWNYPKADTSAWSAFDTTGVSTWTKRYNSDTSWTMGAMGRYASASNPSDVDWGIYSTITHVVTGDSLYLIKLANGSYKKLWIESLSGGNYTFKYSDINGSNLQTATVAKSGYTGQNFAYYSLQNNVALSREPASTTWDLLFTQYTTFIPNAYTVTGILQNKGVHVAKIKQVANTQTFTNWGAGSFKTAINQIGYDWKVFTSSYVIEDSLVYFVKAKNGEIWKFIPSGFGGSSTGNFIFTKEKLSSVGISELNSEKNIVSSVYPNPNAGNNVTLLVDLENIQIETASITLMDLNGREVKNYKATSLNDNSLNTIELSTEGLENGVYILHISLNNSQINHKLIINK